MITAVSNRERPSATVNDRQQRLNYFKFSRNISASCSDIRCGNGVSDMDVHFLISERLRVCCSLLQNPWHGNILICCLSPQQAFAFTWPLCHWSHIKSIGRPSHTAHVVLRLSPAHISHVRALGLSITSSRLSFILLCLAHWIHRTSKLSNVSPTTANEKGETVELQPPTGHLVTSMLSINEISKSDFILETNAGWPWISTSTWVSFFSNCSCRSCFLFSSFLNAFFFLCWSFWKFCSKSETGGNWKAE